MSIEMENYLKELNDTFEAMKNSGQMQDTLAYVRMFFEITAVPFLAFKHSKMFMSELENDPLVLYKLFVGLLEKRGIANPYTFTRDMVVFGNPVGSTDKIAVILMPQPKTVGHSYALLVFMDEDDDYPGVYMVMLGKNNTLHLVNYQTKIVDGELDLEYLNCGVIEEEDAEDVTETAYSLYKQKPKIGPDGKVVEAEKK